MKSNQILISWCINSVCVNLDEMGAEKRREKKDGDVERGYSKPKGNLKISSG